ncbi:MAG TPA: DUF349 domain-containing protein [Salinimicrobium sp.]|nr:DUF349 domain-containing protein [Salinimicrobium sp.]
MSEKEQPKQLSPDQINSEEKINAGNQPAENIVEKPLEEETTNDQLQEQATENSDEKKQNSIEDAMVEESEASAEKSEIRTEETLVAANTEGKEDASTKKKDAQGEMDDAVAEESEDETTNEKHGIPVKEYEKMTQEQLVNELEHLVKNYKIQAIRDHVEEIKTEFNNKFEEDFEEKKEEFLAEGGNIIDFHYSTPLKKRYSDVYFDYKEKRNKYYQNLKQNLEENLKKRLQIIEELKGLIDVEENINTTYKHFKELQERWKAAGAIPRDKYNNVWNNYHHHVENFYDFLHLNREFRDLDFKHNLEQKLKIIDRADELAQEEDTNRAFRELQMLHKMWKEDLGPVAKEYRDELWERFSEATKKIHDKRQEYFKQLDQEREKNLEKKKEIIQKLNEVVDIQGQSHQQLQQQIKNVEALRTEFFNAGKVPREATDEIWTDFKKTVRQFNRNKNAYYKNLKKEQFDNLEKKLELVKIAEENKDNEDMKATVAVMKKIQDDWKKIGHVPRKDSDKIWKRFKAACNHFFDRLHAERNEENKEEGQAFEQKKALLDEVKNTELSGDHEAKLAIIKSFIARWKEIGNVNHKVRFIEGKFNKAIDHLFGQLDLKKSEAEMLKFDNKIQILNDADDVSKLKNEHYFLSKKVEETQAEIRQLENNLQFFSNANSDNPLVREVHKNIEKQKEQLEMWKEKLQKIKDLY